MGGGSTPGEDEFRVVPSLSRKSKEKDEEEDLEEEDVEPEVPLDFAFAFAFAFLFFFKLCFVAEDDTDDFLPLAFS